MAFITEIADYIFENYELNKEQLIVVFPNKRAALNLRNELLKHKNIWIPQISSIQEAMSQLSGLQLMDNVELVFEMLKIMSSNGSMSSNTFSFGLAMQIIKDFDEIDQYAANAKDIFEYAKAAKDIDNGWNPHEDMKSVESNYTNFFAGLNNYYEQLREVLFSSKIGYYGMITRYIYEMSHEELERRIGNKKIIFAGFNAMTLTEENIIVRLVRRGKAKLIWDLDSYYLNDKDQEAGLFAREFFSKYNDLEQNIIRDSFTNNKKNINIIGVSGSAIQTNALQLRLSENNNHDINEVVVLSDESLLIPVLNSIPSNYNGIQVTMGYPYSKTILNQFITHLFAFHKSIDKAGEKIYFWSLKRILETELVKIIFNHNELSKLSGFINSLLRNSVYYVSIKEIEDYFDNGSDLYRFITIITKKWESSESCLDLIKSLLIFIDSKIDSDKNDNFIKNQISLAAKIFNKIERLLNNYKNFIQIVDIEMLYKQTSMEMSIKLISEEEGLKIMGLLETRNLDFDRVHILSVNEGVLPQNKSNSSLIPYELRKEYKLPVYENKQAVYAYHFYRLLQNANEINIYYNTVADGMGEGEISRFVRQLIYEIPKKTNNITINKLVYKNPDIQENETNPISVIKTDEIIDKIKRKLYGGSDSNVKGGLSPTTISCYFRCPLQFYLKYIEGIQDNTPNEQIQSNVIGNIIHSTFESLYKKFGNNIIDLALYENMVENELDNSYNESLQINNFKDGLPDSGFNYLSQSLIKNLIDNFIDCEKEFLKSNKIIIKGLEEKLCHTFNVKSEEIEETCVSLTGKADRIDEVGSNIRILDYKTGAVKNEDVIIKKNMEDIRDLPEKSLQLLIYKYLYCKMNPKIESKSVMPGIIGLLRKSNVNFPLVNFSYRFSDDNFVEECDKNFNELFLEILNKSIPFEQTEDNNNCKNCDFKSVCGRETKSLY